MAAQRKAKSVASGKPQTNNLKRSMEFSGGSSGVLDTSMLPRPGLEQWDGWKSINPEAR
jgi:hypothetical protein